VIGGLFVARALPADAAELAGLVAECFAQPWSERQLADELAQPPPSAILVARARRAAGPRCRAVALCAFRVIVDELHVLDVAVVPDARRQGLARLLLGLALRAGARAGARVGLLEVRAGNSAALALYASLGFRLAGRRRDYYRGPVEDAVLLERAALEELC
jgi:ribosomal-protein-alanine N-acetyltransferase